MKRLAFLGSLIALSPGIAFAQDTSIAERLAAEIRIALPGALVAVPDPDGLDITFADQTRSLGIGAVHRACSQGTTSCDAAIHDYALRAASYMLETLPVSLDQLRIVARSRPYLDNLAAQMGVVQGFVSEPLAGDLVSICYRHLPNGRRPVAPNDLTALQLDQTAALSACKSNFKGALAQLPTFWNALAPQEIGVVRNGDDDVTGYLTAPGDWRPLADRLGSLVVAAPSVDTLLYGRGSNAIEVDAIATLAKQMHAQAAVPLSAQVFRWTDRGWVVAQQ